MVDSCLLGKFPPLKNRTKTQFYFSTDFPQITPSSEGGGSARTSYKICATSSESAKEEEEAARLHYNCQLQTHDRSQSVSPPSSRKGRKQNKHGVGAAVGVGGDGPGVL